ncbi:trypsin-like peptidase domain-containing protein [Macrococcoides canis]|uniref:S1C family serine protease n=1 Tax=Macrococcoides canis TaxID=1855823 RepID=UPI00207C6E33|nr:trypsin-like peptidase domain-containing protein [Macrococcus canis]MCO4096674.1 trypsin-like peptidase domain-containing protein [Macrococcus canis]UTH10002.1 trypsin-like peptidase domain-containing protein [Macrococcus canis]
MKKITIKRRNYRRPKRLFYEEQNKRHIFPYLHKKDEEKLIIEPDVKETVEESAVVPPGIEPSAPLKKAQDATRSNDAEPVVQEETVAQGAEETQDAETTEVSETAHEQEDIETHEVTEEYTEEPIEETPIEEEPEESAGSFKWLLLLLAGILIGIILGALLLPKVFQQKDKPQEKSALSQTELIAKNKDTVVTVTNLQKASSDEPIDAQASEKAPEETGIGSGVIYKLDDKYAYIVTNYHVVGKAPEIEVTQDKLKEKATLIGKDIWTDIAVIRIPKGNLKSTVTFGDSSKLEAGEPVLALGSPLGKIFAGSVTSGIVSGLDRTVPVDIDGDNQYDWSMDVIQTDAAINPGNSGGALFNDKGEMVGLNSLKITMSGVEGIAFSIPANEVRKDIKALEETGSISRPKLGVSVEDLDAAGYIGNLTQGVQVMEVEASSVAQQAGLMQGDVITHLDDKKIEDKIHFRKVLFNDVKIGETITVNIERQGVKKTIKLKLK